MTDRLLPTLEIPPEQFAADGNDVIAGLDPIVLLPEPVKPAAKAKARPRKTKAV